MNEINFPPSVFLLNFGEAFSSGPRGRMPVINKCEPIMWHRCTKHEIYFAYIVCILNDIYCRLHFP